MKKFNFNYPLDISYIREKIDEIVDNRELFSQRILNGYINNFSSSFTESINLNTNGNQYEALFNRGNSKSSFIIETNHLGETILGYQCYIDFRFYEGKRYDSFALETPTTMNIFHRSKLLRIDFYGHRMKKELWDDNEAKTNKRPDYYIEADFVHTVVFQYDKNRYIKIGPNFRGSKGMDISFFDKNSYQDLFISRLDERSFMTGIKMYTLIDSIEIKAS